MTKDNAIKYKDLTREVSDYEKTMTPEDKAAFKEYKPKAVN